MPTRQQIITDYTLWFTGWNLCPTRHKIGHFWRHSSQPISWHSTEDRTDPVKSATSESAVQYRSDTDSDLPWTVRKYISISKRKCKTLYKWCGAHNSAVSGWHWLLSAVNQSRTSAANAIYWIPDDKVVSQSPSAWCVCCVCASDRRGPRYQTIATFDVTTQRTYSAGCKRWALLQKMGLQFTPWIKRWSRQTLTAYSH